MDYHELRLSIVSFLIHHMTYSMKQAWDASCVLQDKTRQEQDQLYLKLFVNDLRLKSKMAYGLS